MVLLTLPVAVAVNKLLGQLKLEFVGDPLHVGDGENTFVADPHRLWQLPCAQQINDLVGLASQDACHVAQKKEFCVVHNSIYAADSISHHNNVVVTIK